MGICWGSLVQNAVGVPIAVLSSLAVVIFVEWQRQPRLVFTIPNPSDQEYRGMPTPAQVMRCLRIRVRNRELPRLLRWMKLATIQFLYPDGTKYSMESMPGRWTGSSEATPL